VEDTRFELVTS